MKRILSAIALIIALSTPAFAQSPCSYIVYGAVLTPAQWNFCFSSKNDALGYIPVNKAGDVMQGPLITSPSSTVAAGFNLPPGAAPTVPNNGDLWSTTAGFFGRANGVTVGPFVGAGSGTFAATSPILVSFPSGVVTYAFDFTAANTFLAQQINQGATTTSPGWYAQIAGDTVPRIRVGLNATDVPSIAFGPGNATRDAFLERVGAGSLRFGAPDAASPVAQTLGVQNVVAGTSNTAGVDLTVNGSRGTGSGAGGSIIFQIAATGSSGTSQNALASALKVFGADGGVTVGSPTGGDKGAGTLNAATNLYVGGNAVASSASSPLVLSATTGALTCPTCVTGTTGALTAGTTATSGYTNGQILGSNGSVLSVYSVSGTGSTVALTAGPTFTGTAAFASLSATGQITSTLATGTAPFVVASTTNVANLNASSLSGATFAAPGPIGSGTASTGAFTTLTSAAHTITSASATSLAVGLNGATNPAFVVDSSTGSQAAGLKVTGAATGGTVAVVAIDSGSNTNLTLNAKGSGTIGIGSVSTGAVTITPATTVTGGLTVSTSFTATGLVTNADLANASTTVNGVVCALGSTCSVTATAANITVGTTGIISGSLNGLLYDNGGTLGNLSSVANGVLVTNGSNIPSIATTLPSGLSIPSPTLTGTVGGAGVIPNAVLANSTISGVSLGSNLTTLTYGTHLTNSAGASTYNGSAASTIATDATNLNTVSTIVARDGSGNFTAGTITAALIGNATNITAASNTSLTSLANLATVGTLTGGATGLGFTISLGTSTVTGQLGIANGGTGTNLTASNGGIVYSNASTLALLSGTVTAGQCLLSGASAAPIWGSCVGAAAVSSVTNSDGSITISPTTGAVVASLAIGHPNSWTAIQTFADSGIQLLGLSTGYTTLYSPNASATNYTLTFPAANDTVTTIAAAQTLTNKTLASTTDVLGGVTMTLGSDAAGDIYYRNSSGVLTRLGIGTSNQVVTVSGGLPSWQTPASYGNGAVYSSSGSNTFTPTVSGVYKVTITGGGATGGTGTADGGGGGGGAGATCVQWFNLVASTGYTASVGAASASSSFSGSGITTATAGPGSVGSNGTLYTGGSGGAVGSCTNSTFINGTSGGSGGSGDATDSIAGLGGSGGGPGGSAGSSTTAAASSAPGPGGGGGGGADSFSAGAGHAGQIIVEASVSLN